MQGIGRHSIRPWQNVFGAVLHHPRALDLERLTGALSPAACVLRDRKLVFKLDAARVGGASIR